MGGALGRNREELRLFADEQAALRRVATLVANRVPPGELFAAVVAEAQRLFDGGGEPAGGRHFADR
jgi:hypothetical protein